MKTIKYEINGTLIDIEVTEEFAEQYEQIEAEKIRQIWRNKKRKESSLERMVEAGFQVADPNGNVEEKLLEKCGIEQLSEAIKTLTEDQKWLIEQVFYYGRKQRDIAIELAIDVTSVRDRLRVVCKKLKKFFNN